MPSVRRKELEAMIKAQQGVVQELQRDERRAKRRARDSLRPPRISGGVWVLLRIVQTLSQNETEANLVATHILQNRCGKRAHPGGGPLPFAPHALAEASVVRSAAGHSDAGFPSRLVWRAAKLVPEARVVLRITDASTRGSSPNAAVIAKWLVDHWPVAERRGRFAAFVRKLGLRAQRKDWASLFRRRWNVRLRIMPWRSAVPPERQSRKVIFGGSRGVFWASFRPQIWVPKTAPFLGTRSFAGTRAAPFLGTKNGPIFGYPKRPFFGARVRSPRVPGRCLLPVVPVAPLCYPPERAFHSRKPRRDGHPPGYGPAPGPYSLCEGGPLRDRYTRMSLAEARGHLTYVAAIADDRKVHRRLPQIFLPHTERMTRADRERLAALAPPLVHIAGTKGWVTGTSFATS